MKNALILLAFYSVLHWIGIRLREDTPQGRAFMKWAAEWRTDWFHGILLSVTVLIFTMCGIVGLALALRLLGI